jgi:hypothetical protein
MVSSPGKNSTVIQRLMNALRHHQWNSPTTISLLLGGSLLLSTIASTIILQLSDQSQSTVNQPQAINLVSVNPQSQTTLKEAKQLANTGQFPKAIALLTTIPPDNPLHSQAQELTRIWSQRILQIAEDYYWQSTGSLNDAIATANEIPSTSPVYTQAQETIQQWQTVWATNAKQLQS